MEKLLKCSCGQLHKMKEIMNGDDQYCVTCGDHSFEYIEIDENDKIDIERMIVL